MRILISLVVAFIIAMFSLTMTGVLAAEEDPVDTPIETPEEPIEAPEESDGENPEFEDGDTGIIDGCEGEIYSTHEAAAAAAAAKGTEFHEHQKEDGTIYYMLNE